jgi:hypothetical protein
VREDVTLSRTGRGRVRIGNHQYSHFADDTRR